MAGLFSESKTKQNLMRAFAGEGQARNRYTYEETIVKLSPEKSRRSYY